MHEEWFKFFDLLIPYVDNEEQAAIEASFSPTDHPDTEFVDITNWFDPDDDLLEKLLALNLELAAKEKRGEAIVGAWAPTQSS
jgi:hypothetical protein